MPLVLSLVPGIGLLDMAFEQEGFCVVRGPDVLWGGDIRRFNPPAGVFQGVIGGPPCQCFSKLSHMVRQNGHEPVFGNLIPEFERCVREARPRWWVMENVPDAPRPFGGVEGPEPFGAEGYGIYCCLLNNRWCIDPETNEPAKPNRLRAWTFGFLGERRVLPITTAVFEHMEYEYAATGGSQRPAKNGHVIAMNRGGKPKRSRMPFNTKSAAAAAQELCRKQGVPANFLEHSPFRKDALCKMLGNGVPYPMGRAIARAVKEVLCCPTT
jgi:DNA (cytosine-5)-methyltransferase 1